MANFVFYVKNIYANKIENDLNNDNQNGVMDDFKPNSTHTMCVFKSLIKY